MTNTDFKILLAGVDNLSNSACELGTDELPFPPTDDSRQLSAEVMNHPPNWDCPDCGQHFTGTSHACTVNPTADSTRSNQC